MSQEKRNTFHALIAGAVALAIAAFVIALIPGRTAEGRIIYGQSQALGVGVVASTHILDGTIVTADISATAGITLDQTTGTITVARGGTGATTLTSSSVILGQGTSTVIFVAPGTSGNVLQSNGTTWTSAAAAASGLISASTTATAFTDTANNTLATISIPAGTLGTTNVVRATFFLAMSNFGNASTTFRVSYGGTNFATSTITATTGGAGNIGTIVANILANASTSAQITYTSTRMGASTGAISGTEAHVYSTSSIAVSSGSAQNLVLTGQNAQTDGSNIYHRIDGYTVEVLR